MREEVPYRQPGDSRHNQNRYGKIESRVDTRFETLVAYKAPEKLRRRREKQILQQIDLQSLGIQFLAFFLFPSGFRSAKRSRWANHPEPTGRPVLVVDRVATAARMTYGQLSTA